MIPLFTDEQFDLAKNKDKLLLKCKHCHSNFYQTKKRIKDVLNPNISVKYDYCSKKCSLFSRSNRIKTICTNCGSSVKKTPSQYKKTINHFCSKSCAASYNNKHKLCGTRRSKLEIYLEKRLTELYPKLHIDYNQKYAINSELDIYIPSLNIAFELNGIFHYEPIYGLNKLQKIQQNDVPKSKACHDAKIDLCVIDTSNLKYFKPSNAQKYLNIITDIIDQRTF